MSQKIISTLVLWSFVRLNLLHESERLHLLLVSTRSHLLLTSPRLHLLLTSPKSHLFLTFPRSHLLLASPVLYLLLPSPRSHLWLLHQIAWFRTKIILNIFSTEDGWLNLKYYFQYIQSINLDEISVDSLVDIIRPGSTQI